MDKFRLRSICALSGLIGSLIAAENVGLTSSVAECHAAMPDEADETAVEQAKVLSRFMSVLEKTPRRGTALDRVYGHHVENGTLKSFLAELRAKLEKTPQDAASWMLLGLLESQRGQDAAAAEAFAKAEPLRPADPLVSFYLAQSQIRIGLNQEAIAALERAIERKPQRSDAVEIFQQLGRLYQRSQKLAEATRVWQRLEEIYPDDVRVLEQIATSLQEEGDLSEAITRFQRVAELTSDDYQKTNSLIQVAALQIQSGQKEQGLAGFEQLLSTLDPDSWLAAQVRERIENVYLDNGDQDGLVKYYEDWIQQHPEDLLAMSRLAQFLNSCARTAEAIVWQEKIIQRAPSRVDFRQQLIDLYLTQGQAALALKQYELLHEQAPQDAEILRSWGQVALKDPSKSAEERQKEAARIWNLIVAAKATDPLTAAQTAELFQQAQMFSQARALYEKAVSLAPDDPQYREYLGEFLHLQKQPAEALRVWREIAAGPRRTAESLASVARLCSKFGYRAEAADLISEACELSTDDFALRLTAAEYLSAVQNFDKSLALLIDAGRLAETEEERDVVIRNRLDVLGESGKLQAETAALAARIAALAEATEQDWILLARYYEATEAIDEATAAADRALRINERSVPALTLAARLREAAGDYAKSAEYSRQLAITDRRSATTHLKNVATLEAALGNVQQAILAAEAMVESAPGSTSSYDFLADICFRFGQNDRGMKALREAVRISGDDPEMTIKLATVLSQQLQTEEAVEVYWRAFEKFESIDDRTSLIDKLVPLYQELNQVDSLLGRLERARSDERQRRSMTICLAQAWQSLGDLGLARTELEKLLVQESRDTRLLKQLATVCRDMEDLGAAIRYQQQLVAIADGEETEIPLALMLRDQGNSEQANEILQRLALRQADPVERLRAVDHLLKAGAFENALRILEPWLSREPENWELIFRDGLARSGLGQDETAQARFQSLLAIDLPLTTRGAIFEKEMKGRVSGAGQGSETTMPNIASGISAIDAYQMTTRLQDLTGIDDDYVSWPDAVLSPRTFAEARILSFIFNRQREVTPPNPAAGTFPQTGAYGDSTQSTTGLSTEQFDKFCVQLIEPETDSVSRMIRLARQNDPSAGLLALLSLIPRNGSTIWDVELASPDRKLSEDELTIIVEAHNRFLRSGEDIVYTRLAPFLSHRPNGDFLAIEGFRGVVFSPGVRVFTGFVISELRLAGQIGESEKLLNEVLAASRTADDFAGNMYLLVELKKFDRVPAEYSRWLEAARKEFAQTIPIGNSPVKATSDQRFRATIALNRWIASLAQQNQNDQILSVLSDYLNLVQSPGFKADGFDRRLQRILPQIFVGQKQFSVQLDNFPGSTDVPAASNLVLAQAYRSLLLNDAEDLLVRALSDRIRNANGDAKFAEQLCLAQVFNWMGDTESMFELLTAAATSRSSGAEAAFQLAELHLLQGNFDEALTWLDRVSPANQQALLRRECAVLVLAKRLGDYRRASTAVEKLLGLRLDPEREQYLIEAARSLGMKEAVSALMRRRERATGNQPDALEERMTLDVQHGDHENAERLARRILQLTQSRRMTGTLFRQNRNHRGSPSRQAALLVLKEGGDLEEMVASLVKRLEQSPDSVQLWDQLIEMATFSGTPEPVLKFLEAATKQRPENVNLRLAYIRLLENSERGDEAFQHYEYLLKQSINALSFFDVDHVYDRFRGAGKLDMLVESVLAAESGHFADPTIQYEIARRIFVWNSDNPLEKRLLDNIVRKNPGYVRQWRMRNSIFWKSDVYFTESLLRLMPTQQRILEDPWSGWSQVEGDATLSDVLNVAMTEARVNEFRTLLQRQLSQIPEWRGGVAILALLNLSTDQRPSAIETLREYAADADRLQDTPADVCWRLGTALDATKESRALATTFVESAIRKERLLDGRISQSAEQHFRTLAESGRTEEAKSLVLPILDAHSSDAESPEWVRVNNVLTAAELFAASGLRSDTIRLLTRILKDPKASSIASQYKPDETDWNRTTIGDYVDIRESVRDDIAAHLEELKGDEVTQAIAEVLSLAPSLDDGGRVDLLLSRSYSDELLLSDQILILNSDLLDTLTKKCDSVDLRQKLVPQIDSLCQEYPDDVSVGVLRTALLLRIEDPRGIDCVSDLMRRVTQSPLPKPGATQVPSRQLLQQSTSYRALWLVARVLIERDLRPSDSEFLARTAVEAALLDTKSSDAEAILLDQSRLLMKKKQFQAAEKALLQYLAIYAPRRRFLDADLIANVAPPDVTVPGGETGEFGEASAMSTANHPMRLPQFEEVMRIAKMAAVNGMPTLSQRAVRRAFAAGFPVPEQSSQMNASPWDDMEVLRHLVGADSEFRERQSAVSSLNGVIAHWHGPSYEPSEVSKILESLVFPASHPRDIELFTQDDQLKYAIVDNLGVPLISWALLAGRENQLRSQIEARKATDPVAAFVLSALLNLAVENTPGAQSDLLALRTMVLEDKSTTVVQLACHAAIPSAKHKALVQTAGDILEVAVQQSWAEPDSNDDETVFSALGQLYHRTRAQTGNLAALEKQVEERLQRDYDSVQFSLRLHERVAKFEQAANEAARVQAPSTAMKFLGVACDQSMDAEPPKTQPAVAFVTNYLRSLEPRERYERWRDWTLQIDQRKSIRVAAEVVPRIHIPDALLDSYRQKNRLPDRLLLCNLTELVDAAAACAALDELQTAVLKADQENVQFAKHLLLLIELRKGESGEVSRQGEIRKQFDEMLRRNQRTTKDVQAIAVLALELVHDRRFVADLTQRAAAIENSVADIEALQGLISHEFSHANCLALDPKRSTVTSVDSLWSPVLSEVTVPNRTHWRRAANVLVGLSGSEMDGLLLNLPLHGDFEFSMEVLNTHGRAFAGFGGVLASINEKQFRVQDFFGKDAVAVPGDVSKNTGVWDRTSLQIKDGMIRYFLNGELRFEEPAVSAVPWLVLSNGGTGTTVVRNLEVQGTPQVLSEVNLIDQGRLDGWSCSTFAEMRPTPRWDSALDSTNGRQIVPEPFGWPVWHIDQGILIGDARPHVPPGEQSWLSHCRALRTGDRLSYEFFYQLGGMVAHPSIGQRAVLLSPEGVKSHWILPPGFERELLALPSDNQFEEPEFVVAQGPLALKPDDWNQVELHYDVNLIHVWLNGEVVFRLPVTEQTDLRPGIFRYKRQGTRVRNLVLKGDWPKTWDNSFVTNLTAGLPASSADDSKAIAALLPRTFLADSVSEVLSQGATPESPQQSFERLRAWVLPNEQHEDFRLLYQNQGPSKILSPAMELVALASKTDGLNALEQDVRKIECKTGVSRRSKTSLLALIAIARQDWPGAKQLCAELSADLNHNIPELVLLDTEAPEYLVAWEASSHAELRMEARELWYWLQKLDDESIASPLYSIRDLQARQERLFRHHVGTSPPEHLTQWQAAAWPLASSWEFSSTTEDWDFVKGEARFQNARRHSFLFFQSPLEGQFEVHFRQRIRSELALVWGDTSTLPRRELIEHLANETAQNSASEDEVPIGAAAAARAADRLADVRLIVNEKQISIFVDGKKIHSDESRRPCDPWLILHGKNKAIIEDVRIIGTPRIPVELDLLASAHLSCWQTRSHNVDRDDDNSGRTSDWRRSGDELVVARSEPDEAAVDPLMYIRPMLEDGELEYEVFWEPGRLECSPAIGKTAILLTAKGPKLQKILDQSDSAHLVAIDNPDQILSAVSAISFRNDDWNKVRLTLQKDVATVFVNDVQVVSLKVPESPAERYFRFVRLATETGSRLRQIKYRGQWPTELPPVKDQQLSLPPDSLSAPDESQDWTMEELDLRLPQDSVKPSSIQLQTLPEAVVPSETGLVVNTINTVGQPTAPIRILFPPKDNFIATVGFQDFEATASDAAASAGFEFSLTSASLPDESIVLALERQSDGPRFVSTWPRWNRPSDNGSVSDERFSLPVSSNSGRLRFIRRGTQLFVMYSEAGSESFRLMNSYFVGDRPFETLEVTGHASAPAPASAPEAAKNKCSIMLNRFELHAPKR